MPKFCEFCGKEIDYLPFSCKYCGSIHCKEHRLPENHACTFELKHSPTIQSDSGKDVRHSIKEYTTSAPQETPEEIRRFLEKEEKRRERERRSFQRTLQPKKEIPASIILPIVIVIMSIVGIILYDFFASLGPIAFNVWKLISGPFVYDFFGTFTFFFFIFFLFFLYFMGRRTEFIYGRKFFILLYIISAYSKLILFTGLRLAFIFVYPFSVFEIVPWSLASSGFIGVLCFSIFPAMNTKIRILLCFVPVEMKGRSFIIILSLFSIIPALIYLGTYPLFPFWIEYLSDLGGIIGSYLIYLYKFRY